VRTYVFASATVRRWLSAATSRWREWALGMRGASPCADRAPPTLPPPLVQHARPATARRRAGPGTAPLGALLFVGARQAVPWFAAFAGLVAVSAAMDPALSARAPDVPGGVVVAVFAMTVHGVAATTFVLLEYFVRAGQVRAVAAERPTRARGGAPEGTGGSDRGCLSGRHGRAPATSSPHAFHADVRLPMSRVGRACRSHGNWCAVADAPIPIPTSPVAGPHRPRDASLALATVLNSSCRLRFSTPRFFSHPNIPMASPHSPHPLPPHRAHTPS
jgi:hypothetical protein